MRKLMIALILPTCCLSSVLVVLADNPCPEQQFGSLDGFNADLIETDPVSGQKLRLPETAVAYVGVPTAIAGRVCDPDGQPLRMIRLDTNQEIPIDPNTGEYEFVVTYSSEGSKFVGLEVTDGIVIRRGTKIIYSVRNRPPVLH